MLIHLDDIGTLILIFITACDYLKIYETTYETLSTAYCFGYILQNISPDLYGPWLFISFVS